MQVYVAPNVPSGRKLTKCLQSTITTTTTTTSVVTNFAIVAQAVPSLFAAYDGKFDLVEIYTRCPQAGLAIFAAATITNATIFTLSHTCNLIDETGACAVSPAFGQGGFDPVAVFFGDSSGCDLTLFALCKVDAASARHCAYGADNAQGIDTSGIEDGANHNAGAWTLGSTSQPGSPIQPYVVLVA